MRRYDLDWLRVIVFGFLIFYHVGMFFVPWEFHIKNNVIYDGLVWPMRFLNQWRLPLLFVISGMGTYFALSRRTGWRFTFERLKRLLLPLAFGMLVIVPPQVYVERLTNGQFIGSYFDFWPWNAFSGVYPIGNLSWHHLWFLPYLFTFSIILLPCFLYLRKHPDCGWLRWVRRKCADPLNIYLFILPLYLIEVYLEPLFPVTHALIGDWFTFLWYLVLFFYGFILVSAKEVFWMVVQKHRRLFLMTGILGFSLLLYRYGL